MPLYIGSIVWQCRHNQKIAKVKMEAKRVRKRGGPPLSTFPPLLQLHLFYGYQSAVLQVSPVVANTSHSVSASQRGLPHQLPHEVHTHIPTRPMFCPFSEWMSRTIPFPTPG